MDKVTLSVNLFHSEIVQSVYNFVENNDNNFDQNNFQQF